MSPAHHRSDAAGSSNGFRFADAPPPMASPAATPMAILLAFALLALGVVAIHDGLVEFDVIGGTAYITELVRGIDGLTPQTWMLWAGVAGILVGLIFLYLALKRRRRLGMELDSDVAMYARPADVARLATETSTNFPEVLSASTSASRRKVNVTVHTPDTPGNDLSPRITEAVRERLSPLKSPPRVSVRAHGGSR